MWTKTLQPILMERQFFGHYSIIQITVHTTVHTMPILPEASYSIDIAFLGKIKTKDQTLKLLLRKSLIIFLRFRNDLNDFAGSFS